MYANQRARNSLADGVSIRSEQFLSGGTISDSIRRTTVATRRPSAISENNEGALCEKMSIYFADTESQISTGGATQPCWPEKKNPQAACVEGSRTIRNEEAKRIRAPWLHSRHSGEKQGTIWSFGWALEWDTEARWLTFLLIHGAVVLPPKRTTHAIRESLWWLSAVLQAPHGEGQPLRSDCSSQLSAWQKETRWAGQLVTTESRCHLINLSRK